MIRLGTPADLAAARGVYRRASLSNAGDRDSLLAHPDYLVLGPEGLAEGRTHVTANPHAMEFYRAAGFTACGVAETPFGAVPRMVLVLSPLPDEARDQGPRDPRRDPEPRNAGA